MSTLEWIVGIGLGLSAAYVFNIAGLRDFIDGIGSHGGDTGCPQGQHYVCGDIIPDTCGCVNN